MILDISICSDPGLGFILRILKSVFILIEVIAPIVLIVSSAAILSKLLANPEDKKLKKYLSNAVISCVIIFLLPLSINLTMYLIGEDYTFSECWNNAYSSIGTSRYIEKENNKEPTKVYVDPEDYPKGSTGINPNKGASTEGASSIAELAASVAGSYAPEDKITNKGSYGNLWVRISDPRVQNYQDIVDAVSNTGNGHDNGAYCSCTQAAAAIIRATVDKEFWMMDPTDALNYMQKSSNWKLVGVSNDLSSSELQPGDVFATTHHTMIWVSNEVARKYRSDTTGNMFQADSIMFAFPGIDQYPDGYIGGGYQVFRFVGTPDPAIDYSKYLK